MNWGKGLALSMALFMVFIITLTAIKISKVNELEHEDYYAREINYEQEIQAQRNAGMYDKIEYRINDDFLVLNIPETIEVKDVEVILLRPNDKNLDKAYHFQQSKTLLISKDELQTGVYKMEIHYQIEEKDCLIKEEIII